MGLLEKQRGSAEKGRRVLPVWLASRELDGLQERELWCTVRTSWEGRGILTQPYLGYWLVLHLQEVLYAFKKIRDTKGTFHAKMETTKDRNGMDLTETEDIKKRWQQHTGELYKKDLHGPDSHKDVITHLEPDILEYEVKWAWWSITMSKASGGDGIPVELFQILKDDAVKVLHSICQKIWKTQQWPQDWKKSVFIPISKKVNAKECSDYCTIAVISQTSKIMLKILQARLLQQ